MFVCPRCFGPLEATYDLDSLRQRLDRATLDARPRIDLALRGAPARRVHPHRRRAGRTLPTRVDPPACCCPGSRASLGEGRFPEPHAVLQGPGRRLRCRACQGLRLHHARVCQHRQPRAGRRRGCGRHRAGRGGLHPRRPGGRQGGPGPGTGRHRGACGRPVRRRQPAVPGADRRAGGLGGRERQPSAVLCRGFQDHRLRDRPATRLADARRGRGAPCFGLAVYQDRSRLRGARAGRAHR